MKGMLVSLLCICLVNNAFATAAGISPEMRDMLNRTINKKDDPPKQDIRDNAQRIFQEYQNNRRRDNIPTPPPTQTPPAPPTPTQTPVPPTPTESDACTRPKDFTTDKRCYVTDQQKRTLPYKAVVRVTTAKQGSCTGTIVENNGQLYMYTAKHCVVDKADKVADTLTIAYQTGETETVRFNNVGTYSGLTEYTSDQAAGDWAIYSLPTGARASYVNRSKHRNTPSSQALPARLVGYGALKIMSDKEITDFKNKYKKWLKDNKLSDKNYQTKGVVIRDGPGMHFVNDLEKNDKSYYSDLFYDGKKLKVSKCQYYSNGRYKDCQAWSGNSGGPVFDNDGNIMGIHSGGRRTVGAFTATYSVSLIGTTDLHYPQSKALSFPDPVE